ncbi:MAG: 2-dehydropantoate 2-reductase N-terminal domain-containing protein [Dehalococcoidia bacterium]
MRYVIYGAGAIGGSIGARLFQHEREVVLICRGAHLEAVRRDGLTFRTPAETVTLPITAVGHPSEVQFRGDEVVLLTMKSQDTAAALDELRAAAGDVPVVCAQNGVANERMALRRFSMVYGMLVVLPATHLEPGVVLMHATAVGGVLDAGCYPTGVEPLIEQVTAEITASGFSARPDPNVMRLKYSKLLGNLGNAVQALCERDDAAGELMRLLRAEAVACYEAAGIDFAPPEDLMGRRSAALTPGQIEGAPRSGGSTWQSLARGAGALETDFLNGEIALLGALHGVPTPYNRAVQQAAAEAVREGAQPGSYGAEQIMARAKELAEVRP